MNEMLLTDVERQKYNEEEILTCPQWIQIHNFICLSFRSIVKYQEAGVDPYSFLLP